MKYKMLSKNSTIHPINQKLTASDGDIEILNSNLEATGKSSIKKKQLQEN
jgi:hypothetical protein